MPLTGGRWHQRVRGFRFRPRLCRFHRVRRSPRSILTFGPLPLRGRPLRSLSLRLRDLSHGGSRWFRRLSLGHPHLLELDPLLRLGSIRGAGGGCLIGFAGLSVVPGVRIVEAVPDGARRAGPAVHRPPVLLGPLSSVALQVAHARATLRLLWLGPPTAGGSARGCWCGRGPGSDLTGIEGSEGVDTEAGDVAQRWPGLLLPRRAAALALLPRLHVPRRSIRGVLRGRPSPSWSLENRPRDTATAPHGGHTRLGCRAEGRAVATTGILWEAVHLGAMPTTRARDAGARKGGRIAGIYGAGNIYRARVGCRDPIV